MSNASSNALTAYLAEYDVLTAEINTRFESQRLSFTLTVTLLGAVVAALTQGKLSGDAPTALLLAVPIFIAPAAAIFFDNEMMIYRLANRIVNVLQPEVAALVGEPRALSGHEYGLGGVRRFTQHGLSLTRWILFVTGPVVATLLLATQPVSYPIHGPLERFAFIVGCLLDVWLLWAMGVAASFQFESSSKGASRSAMSLQQATTKRDGAETSSPES
jgi:hypothetical protein